MDTIASVKKQHPPKRGLTEQRVNRQRTVANNSDGKPSGLHFIEQIECTFPLKTLLKSSHGRIVCDNTKMKSTEQDREQETSGRLVCVCVYKRERERSDANKEEH